MATLVTVVRVAAMLLLAARIVPGLTKEQFLSVLAIFSIFAIGHK